MQNRTIRDLHSKDYGHRKFSKICDLLSKNHKLTDIKEYYEKFKFKVDGYEFEYSKEWKSSAKEFVQYLENLLDAKINFNRLLGF